MIWKRPKRIVPVVKAQAKLEAELESLAELKMRAKVKAVACGSWSLGELNGLISQELCAEDALRTAMQYLIHKIGVSNAIVATPGLDGWQLGAYVNVDAREATQDVVDRVLERADHFASANVICSNGTELQTSLIWTIPVLMATCVWTGSYDETKPKPV